MKKYLFIFFTLLAAASFNANAQSKLTEQEVKELLCHKWKAVIMEIQGKQYNVEKEEDELFLTFLKDGTFIDSQEGNKSAKIKWTYTHSTMTLNTGGVLKKIFKIDDKELKFKSKMDGQNVIVTFKRVD
ncbi:hypothetical protein FAM09_15980 [Niastella caeni]|uniref:Lipocalin-like domain-containing protein n=1 Tax=Niastella caeni TaxID=2569763 RepID=A0A4S8HRN8_9BACT|nr:hypothetical protein [Niastella caeni]THU38178.1 hypothetical protein FAM09_15980 [Niastella caeni]